MTIRLREIRHVAGLVVERRRRIGCLEERRASFTAQEKRPLVAARVPVDLAQSARLHRHDRGGEVLRNRERLRVDDLDGSAGNLVRGLLGEMVRVALLARDDACCGGDVLVFDVVGGARAGEDV